MKRFIAGANCPQCKQTDTLYFETSETEDRVHCSRCDYTELRVSEISTDDDEHSSQREEQTIKWH